MAVAERWKILHFRVVEDVPRICSSPSRGLIYIGKKRTTRFPRLTAVVVLCGQLHSAAPANQPPRGNPPPENDMTTKTNQPTTTGEATAMIKTATTLNRREALVGQIGTVRKGSAWHTPNRNTIVCVAAGGDRAMHAGIVAMAAWTMDRLQITNTVVALGIVARLPGALGNATAALTEGVDELYVRQQGRHYFARVNILANTTYTTLNAALQTVAHEIVHVHQYHRGMLKFISCLDPNRSGKTGYEWNGNGAYGRKGEYPVATLPEWSKRPWERHARAMEKTLVEQYTTAGKELKDRMTDRYHRSSTPKSATVLKWMDALATGTKQADGTVIVTLDGLVSSGLGATWLRKMHGWLDGKTCQRAAHESGFHGVLHDHRTESPYVVLTPLATPNPTPNQ